MDEVVQVWNLSPPCMSAERARRPPSAEGALGSDQRRGVDTADTEHGELAPLSARMLSLRAAARSLRAMRRV